MKNKNFLWILPLMFLLLLSQASASDLTEKNASNSFYYYATNSSTTIGDWSTNGNDGVLGYATVVGGGANPNYVDDTIDYWEFVGTDGAESYIDSQTMFSNAQITYASWFNSKATPHVTASSMIMGMKENGKENFYTGMRPSTGYGQAFSEHGSTSTNSLIEGSVSLFDGDWHLIIAEYNGTTKYTKLWVDNVYIGQTSPIMYSTGYPTSSLITSVAVGCLFDGVDGGDHVNNGFTGNITMASMWEGIQLTSDDRTELWNSGTPHNIYDFDPSIITYELNNTQEPLDLTITDMEGLIVNTSITTNKEYDELNNSYTSFNYYINTSLNNNCVRFENQLCTLNNGEIISLNMTKINNTYFTTNEITDINIFPVYSPYTIESVAVSTKQNYTIYKNNHIKFKILNYTTIGNGDLFTSIGINFDNLTQDEPLNTYYCNSTYTTGNPSNLDECDLVQTIFKEDFFTHFHNNTKHTQIPIHPNINTTQLSYLIFTSEVALSSNGWEVAYYTNDSYNNDSFEIGSYNAWSNTNNIFDIHLHQLYQNDSINYYTSFNDGSNNITNSSLTTDYFNVTNFAPFGVSIYDPCNITYTLGSDSNTSIYFNWSETTDFNNDPFIQNVSIHPVGVILEYDLFTVNNGTWEYNYITDKETFINSEYKIEILLTDNYSNNELSESICTFNICINNWVNTTSTCINNTQIVTWTDNNDCPIKYDLPSNNGTSIVCESTIATDENIMIIVLLLFIWIFIIITWFYIQNPTIGIVATLYLALLTTYLYNIYNDDMLLIGMIFVNMIVLWITILTFRK